ncbi:MAG: ethylbenzene dehydrogenase-related protein [Planctomycetota bacterium]
MKRRPAIVITSLLIVVVILSFSCAGSKDSATTLVVKKAKSAPVMDGRLDDMWQLAKSIEIPVEVADYEFFDPMFRGKKYNVTMRAMTFESDLYVFAQWTADQEASWDRESWYYNDAAGKWMQRPGKKPDAYTPPAYEDKFAILWNMNSADFAIKGGTIFCHKAYKHTNLPDERMDLWHWKLVRTGPVNQLDDTWVGYVDESAGGTSFNGRKSDAGNEPFSNNKQTLQIAGAEVTLPLYWIPKEESYYYIMDGEPKARKIVGMDKDKNLIDEDGTVLVKEDFALGSKFLIPSIKGVKTATGSRGDVAVFEDFDEGTKTWNLEMRRKLVTNSDDDIQFGDLKKTYDFSVAVFNNTSIAHATPEGLLGKAYSLKF